MDEALEYKPQHPSESYSKLSERFGIPPMTIRNRYSGGHAARGTNMVWHLSDVQEDALAGSINSYANRGTLLTPEHVQQLATRLCGNNLGRNWTSTFLRRHKHQVLLHFYKIQELARLKADTPEMRKVFLTLVSLSSRV